MAHAISNGHVTDDVKPQYIERAYTVVKLVTPIRIERNISKTAGDSLP